ncbi:MAG: serine/threonine protein kinase [Polyangiaceae bacterium]|nr:serine/threonine protein kinase [Polyangiaceae bacterium]
MAYSENTLFPIVTVSLFDRSEIEGLVMSALDGSMALVPIPEELTAGSYILELSSPDRARPLLMLGELAGDPSGGMCPMFLKPIDGDNADELIAFLGRASLPPDYLPDAPKSSRPLMHVRVLTPPGSLPALERAITGERRNPSTLQSIASPDLLPEDRPNITVVTPSALGEPGQPEAVDGLRGDPNAARTAVTLDNDLAAISSAPASVTNDPLLGRALGGGKYVIVTLIGAGGAGSVYRAHHVMLQKDIAIKVMHPSLRKEPNFAARFHSEALAASRLDHPNVLRVLDFGEEPDGLLYIAMELLVGTELRALLWQGRIPLVRTLDIVCQICAALSAASEVGIVHRDIKPENVVITSSRDDEGTQVDLVKVCDFGLATISKPGTAGSGEHKAAFIAGTPDYMSPEQARGEELDGRSDIYAVGVLLYELLTGHVPFEESSPLDVLKAHVQSPVRPPSQIAKDVDPEVEAVVLRALAKDRHQRHSTAREMRGELRGILERVKRPPIADSPSELSALPIEDAAAGFGEMFVALTAAVARTTYYERDHPEFARSLVRLVHASRVPLTGRGEITFTQRDLRDSELLVQTGIGEIIDLRRAVPGGIAEAYGPRFSDVFQRRHVVSLTLKEGVSEHDLADATELLSGPEMAADALRLDFLSRGLSGVSILFAEELLGKSRKLPWHVDLCISRLARDLRALPLLRGVNEDTLRSLRMQLVADVVRNLERPEDVRLLLENTDLVASSVQHIPELGSLDMRSVIVSALRRPLAVATTKHLLATPARATPPPMAGDARPPPPGTRTLLAPFASRFLRERSADTDQILRSLLEVRVLDLADLPRELQISVAAERLAAQMAQDPEALLQRLSQTRDLSRFGDEMAAAGRALLVLARAGDAKTVAVIATGLSSLARGASTGEQSREAIAASALAAIADALLFGPVQQREPARTVLSKVGPGAARALMAARLRGAPASEPFPRPRFVAAMREIGKAALPALAEHISRLDPEGMDAGSDPALIEDLLRSLPDVVDEGLGRAVARFLRHALPAVRRATAGALPLLLGSKAKPPLVHALDDIDEGVRTAALSALRAIRAIDEDVVTRVDSVLNSGAPSSEDLRAGAAGALADVRESAKARAVDVLTRALRPKTRSLVSIFKSDTDGDSVLLLTTVARVLLHIGGTEGRKEVERRMGSSRGELKRALQELLR